MNICAKTNICASKSASSQSPKTLAAMLARTLEIKRKTDKMHTIYTYIFLLIFTVGFSQNQKFKTAADEIISQIEQIEKGYGYNIKLPNSIACLTGIYPKNVDGTYSGIIYYPTNEELKIWKNLVNKNQLKIKYNDLQESNLESYIFEIREILYEYEPEKFRSNFCK